MNIHMHLHIMYHTHICIPIYIQFHILIQYTSHTSIQHVYSLNFHIHVHKIYTHITLTHLYSHILSYMHTQHIPHTSHPHMYVVIPTYNTCTCMYTHIMITWLHTYSSKLSVQRLRSSYTYIQTTHTHVHTEAHKHTSNFCTHSQNSHVQVYTHVPNAQMCAHHI